MACTIPDPIITFIRQAYLYAGDRDNATLSAQQVTDGITTLNMVLSQWAGSPLLIFYESVYEFITVDTQLDFAIGTIGDENFPVLTQNANPFSDISFINVVLGNITYTPQYITPQAFAAITVKSVSGLPSVYTFENRDTYTLLRIYPQVQTGSLIQIHGKQTLTNVNLYSSVSDLYGPDQLFLQYEVANHLANMGYGNRNQNFDETRQELRNTKVGSARLHTSLDYGTKPGGVRRRGIAITGGRY